MTDGVGVERLALTLGRFRLQEVSFNVARGEVLVILGPNGAGKSVTLETIAGFHRPQSGFVRIGGRDVTALPPERRNVGFVVQNFGLFPHLSVLQNVKIGRDGARAEMAEGAQSALPKSPAALLDYFGIAHLAKRAPPELSPGEKQRVALARALASAPEAFLFDEPFSALDAATRGALRDELKSFLRAVDIPAIFVTHDRSDAMTLADRMVVLRDGVVVQSGAARDVFQKPANSLVARFVGVENLLPGLVTDGSERCTGVKVGDRTLRVAAANVGIAAGGSVLLSIRGEDVRIVRADGPAISPRNVNRLQGRVTALATLGPLVSISIDCGFVLKAYLLASEARERQLALGTTVALEIAADDIRVLAS